MYESIISEEQKNKFFSAIRNYLLNSENIQQFQLNRHWAQSFYKTPGVYCFFIDSVLMYVGETGDLQGRMLDMLNTLNHTCRRTIGERHFSHVEGFAKATSKRAFPLHIEKLLTEWIEEHLSVSVIPVHIGRKEFEEWLQEQMSDIDFYNKRKKRGSKKKLKKLSKQLPLK